MTYAREQLRHRLAKQVGQAYLRWLHTTSGRRPHDRFLSQRTPTPADCCSVRGGQPVRTPAAGAPASQTTSTAAAVWSAAPDTAAARSGQAPDAAVVRAPAAVVPPGTPSSALHSPALVNRPGRRSTGGHQRPVGAGHQTCLLDTPQSLGPPGAAAARRRRGAGLLVSPGSGIGGPGAQDLGHRPFANRTRPGALGVQVGQPSASPAAGASDCRRRAGRPRPPGACGAAPRPGRGGRPAAAAGRRRAAARSRRS
jgi:hypothetical protein